MIERLTLTDFRNHRAARLDAGPGFVVLAGENGAGKTNILEAISLLAPGRGMRRAPLGTMARDGGAGGFAISAELPGDVTIGTGTQPGTSERRIVRINGAAASAASLAEWLTLLWLTPAMDRLFVEPAGERRRFLDRLTLALEPGHATHATRYDAAMRARNRLLSEDAPADPDWLAALEAQMSEHGRAIAVARTATVDALTARLDATPPGAFARALVSLDGDPGDALAERLAASRQRDAAAARALVGPHRDDLIVEHRDKRQPAAQCSTGEQKALLLGIVLAHADIVADRAGAPPVLLLDEVAAHLDPRRRAALFDRLAGRGQVWMTGTEPSLFDDARPATRYRVAEGAIERIA